MGRHGKCDQTRRAGNQGSGCLVSISSGITEKPGSRREEGSQQRFSPWLKNMGRSPALWVEQSDLGQRDSNEVPDENSKEVGR